MRFSYHLPSLTRSSTSSFIDHDAPWFSISVGSLSLPSVSSVSVDFAFTRFRHRLRRSFAALSRASSATNEHHSSDSSDSSHSRCGGSSSSGSSSPLAEFEDSDDGASVCSEWLFVPTERERLLADANVKLEALRRWAYTAMVLMEYLEASYVDLVDEYEARIEHFAFSKRRAASYKDFHRRRHAGIEDLCEIEALLIDVCHFATALLDATTPKRTFAAYEPTRDELERMLEEVAWRNDWTGKEWARIREVLF